MILSAILLVLLIDRVLWDIDAYRRHDWYGQYLSRTLQTTFGAWLGAQTWGIALFLLPPLLLVWIVQDITSESWNRLLEWLLAVTVLLFSLGPRDLGRDVERYQESKLQEDTETIMGNAAVCCNMPAPGEEPVQSLFVARCVLVQAHSRLFAPLFWFSLLGPLGAVLYRTAWLTQQHLQHQEDCPSQATKTVRLMLALLEWIPARLTTVGYAVVGNFERVAQVWQDFHRMTPEQGQSDAERLLGAAGVASLESYPEEDSVAELDEIPPVVEDALAAVWRNLTLWLIVIGTTSLFIGI